MAEGDCDAIYDFRHRLDPTDNTTKIRVWLNIVVCVLGPNIIYLSPVSCPFFKLCVFVKTEQCSDSNCYYIYI